MAEIIIACIQGILLILVAPLVSGIARWFRAKMQTRRGPSIFQDYYDIVKLFKRQDLRTKHSSFIHRFMPPLYFGVMVLMVLGLPTITRFSPIPALADLILIVYLLALPRFFFALASVDSGSSYAGKGGIRELLLGVLVEPTIILALFVAVLATGATNIGDMGQAIGSLTAHDPVAVVIAGIAFAFACYMELGKLPYDMAEAEQELQDGPLSEYSGPSLAMTKVSLSMKQIVIVSLFIAVFIPFGSATAITVPAIALGVLFYLIKMIVIFSICTVIENVVSRVRYKLLGRQTWAVFGISVVALVFCVLGL